MFFYVLFYNELMNILIIIVVITAIYLSVIYPNTSRRDSLAPYHEVYICHRGLYNNKDVPENSLMAFRKSVENGYGIELDVQITTDDQLVVFHDDSLFRMTGIDKNLNDCSYEELQQYPLLDTKETIPLFSDVLKLLKPETPLVIEIKEERRYVEVTKMTVEMMKDYDGLYNMESFNPLVVKYLKDNYPQIIRGQLSYDYIHDEKSKLPKIMKFVLTYLLLNCFTRPDYVAYDCENMKNLSFRIISRLYKAECIAWTVKSQEKLEECRKYYQSYIFDTFIPK